MTSSRRISDSVVSAHCIHPYFFTLVLSQISLTAAILHFEFWILETQSTLPPLPPWARPAPLCPFALLPGLASAVRSRPAKCDLSFRRPLISPCESRSSGSCYAHRLRFQSPLENPEHSNPARSHKGSRALRRADMHRQES